MTISSTPKPGVVRESALWEAIYGVLQGHAEVKFVRRILVLLVRALAQVVLSSTPEAGFVLESVLQDAIRGIPDGVADVKLLHRCRGREINLLEMGQVCMPCRQHEKSYPGIRFGPVDDVECMVPMITYGVQ